MHIHITDFGSILEKQGIGIKCIKCFPKFSVYHLITKVPKQFLKTEESLRTELPWCDQLTLLPTGICMGSFSYVQMSSFTKLNCQSFFISVNPVALNS